MEATCIRTGGTTKKQLKIMKSAEIQAISADFMYP